MAQQQYYLLREYVKKGFDFNKVYPDKVEEVKTLTGMLFNLQDIVNYLQKETKDFKIENPVAKDLSDAIYKLVIKAEGKSEAPEPEEDTASEVQEWALSADGLYELLSGDTSDYDPNDVADWKSALDLLVGILEDNNYMPEEIKKYKSVL
jgi:hypothetical protein